MSRLTRIVFLLGFIVGLPRPLAQAEEIQGLYLNDNFAGYEEHLRRALGADAAAPTNQPVGLATLDAQAAALERGDWQRAYREANAAEASADPVLAARGRARGAWILARLGLPHAAIGRVNDALPEPTARGEVMLARAWMLWQVGAFKLADEQFELAVAAQPAPPAWALAEWRKLRAARAKDAAAFAALDEPDDSSSPAFLDYADKARATGAFNGAASLYTQALSMLQQQQDAAPGTPRTNLDRAYHGIRESLLGAVGGRLPGADYPAMRTVVLLTARQIATESGQRAMWETYFQLLAETLGDRGQLDYAPFSLATDLAVAERQGGVGPEWRERFRPLLSDPKLRYAAQVQQAIVRAVDSPAYSLEPEVADVAALDALVARLAQDEAMLKGLRATLPAGVEPLPQEQELAQIAAVMRLRQALARKDRGAAEALLALVSEEGDRAVERRAYRAALDANERQELIEALERLDKFTLAELPADALAHALECARRAQARLGQRLGTDAFHPEKQEPADREEFARIGEIKVLAAAHDGKVLQAETELAALEQWCKSLPGYKRLESAQVAVLEMEAKMEPFTPEEQAIADAIAADRPDVAAVPVLQAINQSQRDRLASRLLLARLHWALCQDHEAGKVVADLRGRLRVNDSFSAQLDAEEARNDTFKIGTALVERVRTAAPARRVAVAREVERELGQLLDRYHRRLNAGKPIPRGQDIGMAIFPYLHLLAAVGCTQAAQGNLRGAVDALEHVTSNATIAMLRGFVTEAPFRNDLPSEAHVKAWRELLADRDLSPAVLMALHEIFRPHYNRSLTADLALALLRIRNREFAQAKKVIASLRERYGVNRAYAAQLSEIDTLIARQTEIVILFESSAGAKREREIAQYDKERFVSANFESIKETYQNDGQSSETRHVEALEKRIDELADTANAIDERNERKVAAAERDKADAQTRIFARLRELTL